ATAFLSAGCRRPIRSSASLQNHAKRPSRGEGSEVLQRRRGSRPGEFAEILGRAMKLLDTLLGGWRSRPAPSSTQPIDSLLQRYGSFQTLRLSNATILCAARCAKAVDGTIEVQDKSQRHEVRFLVVCEFFYCFLHLVNRQFYTRHSEPTGRIWQKQLGPLVIEDF